MISLLIYGSFIKSVLIRSNQRAKRSFALGRGSVKVYARDIFLKFPAAVNRSFQHLIFVFYESKTIKKLTDINLARDLWYTLANSSLMSSKSTSDRVTMIRISVLSSVPRPCEELERIKNGFQIKQEKD